MKRIIGEGPAPLTSYFILEELVFLDEFFLLFIVYLSVIMLIKKLSIVVKNCKRISQNVISPPPIYKLKMSL